MVFLGRGDHQSPKNVGKFAYSLGLKAGNKITQSSARHLRNSPRKKMKFLMDKFHGFGSEQKTWEKHEQESLYNIGGFNPFKKKYSRWKSLAKCSM